MIKCQFPLFRHSSRYDCFVSSTNHFSQGSSNHSGTFDSNTFQISKLTVLFIFLSPPRFLLEIRVVIKISKKFLVSHKLWLIWIRMKQFFFSFLKKKKKIKMANSKKTHFPAPSVLNIFSIEIEDKKRHFEIKWPLKN